MNIHKLIALVSLPLLALSLGCSANSSSTPPRFSSSNAQSKAIIAAQNYTSASLSSSPTLNECLLYALRESAEIKSAFNLYQAALEKAPQVSALPEPRLSYGYFIDSIETRVGPMRHKIGLAQPFPWFGKLSLREEIAGAEAEAAFYSFLTRKNKLVSEVVKAFYELAYIGEAKTITAANLELLKRWELVLTQRYRSQVGTQANLIKVQLELGKLEDKLRELNELHRPLKAQLNALLNRPTHTPIEVSASSLELTRELQTANQLTSSKHALVNVLNSNNPELLLLDALVKARASGIELAEKEFYPDLSIGIDYTVIGDRGQAGSDSGDDGIATVFSVNIPINFSKYRAGLREAEHRKRASEQMLESKRLKLSSDLARNFFNLSDSKRRISLYKSTLVPKAEEALESTFTAFELGESSFLDLLDSERELLEFQLMLSRSKADLAIAASELNALLGEYSDSEPFFSGESK